MRSSSLVLFAGLVVLNVVGCGALWQSTPTPSVGWNFSVGRPSTMHTNAPIVLNQQSGAVGIQPTGVLNGTSPTIIHSPMPMGPASMSTKGNAEFFVSPCNPPGDPCTLNVLCQKVDGTNMKLDKLIDVMGAKRE